MDYQEVIDRFKIGYLVDSNGNATVDATKSVTSEK